MNNVIRKYVKCVQTKQKHTGTFTIWDNISTLWNNLNAYVFTTYFLVKRASADYNINMAEIPMGVGIDPGRAPCKGVSRRPLWNIIFPLSICYVKWEYIILYHVIAGPPNWADVRIVTSIYNTISFRIQFQLIIKSLMFTIFTSQGHSSLIPPGVVKMNESPPSVIINWNPPSNLTSYPTSYIQSTNPTTYPIS